MRAADECIAQHQVPFSEGILAASHGGCEMAVYEESLAHLLVSMPYTCKLVQNATTRLQGQACN